MSDETRSQQLQQGSRIAWVIRSYGKTSGVSAIHRVFEDGLTYCQHPIPDESRLFPPLKSLNVCSRCERLSARVKPTQQKSA